MSILHVLTLLSESVFCLLYLYIYSNGLQTILIMEVNTINHVLLSSKIRYELAHERLATNEGPWDPVHCTVINVPELLQFANNND